LSIYYQKPKKLSFKAFVKELCKIFAFISATIL